MSRRWGCVVPTVLFGLAFSVGGASIVHDWWAARGIISSSLLVVCLFGGPGLLFVACKIHSDPNF